MQNYQSNGFHKSLFHNKCNLSLQSLNHKYTVRFQRNHLHTVHVLNMMILTLLGTLQSERMDTHSSNIMLLKDMENMIRSVKIYLINLTFCCYKLPTFESNFDAATCKHIYNHYIINIL